MSSFLSTQAQLRRGKWTAEEEVYASGLMDAFKEGSLRDVDEGMSLRGYLAKKLRTNVKRISKKYEGTNYSGKRVYTEKPHLDKDLVAARHAKLRELELKFEKSVKLMQDAESAKKDMARLNNNNTDLLSSVPPSFPGISNCTNNLGSQSGAFPPGSLAASASFISRDVMEDNLRILAHQGARSALGVRSLSSTDSLATANNALRMASFGSLSSLETQALVEGMTASPTSPTAAAAAAAAAIRSGNSLALPTNVSATMLNHMLLQHQQEAAMASIRARVAEEGAAQLLAALPGFATGAATRALEHPPSPPMLALKRPQLASYIPVASTNKRARLH